MECGALQKKARDGEDESFAARALSISNQMVADLEAAVLIP